MLAARSSTGSRASGGTDGFHADPPFYGGGGGADWQTPQSGSSREGLNTGGIVVSYAAKSIAVIVSDPDGHVSETYSDESL